MREFKQFKDIDTFKRDLKEKQAVLKEGEELWVEFMTHTNEYDVARVTSESPVLFISNAVVRTEIVSQLMAAFSRPFKMLFMDGSFDPALPLQNPYLHALGFSVQGITVDHVEALKKIPADQLTVFSAKQCEFDQLHTAEAFIDVVMKQTQLTELRFTDCAHLDVLVVKIENVLQKKTPLKKVVLLQEGKSHESLDIIERLLARNNSWVTRWTACLDSIEKSPDLNVRCALLQELQGEFDQCCKAILARGALINLEFIDCFEGYATRLLQFAKDIVVEPNPHFVNHFEVLLCLLHKLEKNQKIAIIRASMKALFLRRVKGILQDGEPETEFQGNFLNSSLPAAALRNLQTMVTYVEDFNKDASMFNFRDNFVENANDKIKSLKRLLDQIRPLVALLFTVRSERAPSLDSSSPLSRHSSYSSLSGLEEPVEQRKSQVFRKNS